MSYEHLLHKAPYFFSINGASSQSRRHMELMQKNVDEFKSFARVLAGDRIVRESYVRVSETLSLKHSLFFFIFYIL